MVFANYVNVVIAWNKVKCEVCTSDNNYIFLHRRNVNKFVVAADKIAAISSGLLVQRVAGCHYQLASSSWQYNHCGFIAGRKHMWTILKIWSVSNGLGKITWIFTLMWSFLWSQLDALLVLCLVGTGVDSIPSGICDGVPDQSYVRDPAGCSTFYVCRDGEEPLFSECLNDYWFNEETGYCDFQQNVICHLFVSTTPVPTTTMTRDPNVEEGIECPSLDNPWTIQFLPSLIDCERYYICYHGRPIPMRCLDGFYWSQATQLCDYPTSAQCAVSVVVKCVNCWSEPPNGHVK